MTRKECLDKAAGCVLTDRNNEYGKPEDCFGVIANFWSVYLGRKVYPADVAMMMSLLKIARIKANRGYADGYVDLAGYAACGAECASRIPSPAPKSGDEVVVLWKHKPKAEANHPENPDSSEYKSGDKVQARLADGVWRDAVVRGKEIIFEKLHYTVKIADFDGYYSLPFNEVRSIPKAEGCEALVEKDAPQTTQELYSKILESNPATYGPPRTPTGEELAEMAEEEGNAKMGS